MKKVSLFLNLISVLLVVGFAVRLGVDYFKDYEFGSAPFYLYVLVRAVEFIIPAIICFIIAGVLKRKAKKNNKD